MASESAEEISFPSPGIPYLEFDDSEATLKKRQEDFLAAANAEKQSLVERTLRYIHSDLRTCDWYKHDPRDEQNFLVSAIISGDQDFIDEARKHLQRCYISNEGYGYVEDEARSAVKEDEATIKESIQKLLHTSDRLLAIEEHESLKDYHEYAIRLNEEWPSRPENISEEGKNPLQIERMRKIREHLPKDTQYHKAGIAEMQEAIGSEKMLFIGEGTGEAADPNFEERMKARKDIQEKLAR